MSDGSNYLDPNRRTPCGSASATRGHSAKRRSAASDTAGDDARIITDQLPRRCRIRNARFRPRRRRQQCRLCRGLSRRRNRDWQGETDRDRDGRRLQQLFSGRNAYYLERIVNAGLVGLHTASGSPHIVPPGATRPALGTNPIAFGFPSADGPVIFDIGTASLMWGEVLLAAETGEALPPGVAFDATRTASLSPPTARANR
jgi:hypothetical protein